MNIDAYLYTVLVNFSLMIKSHQEKLKMITMSKRFFGNELADGGDFLLFSGLVLIAVNC